MGVLTDMFQATDGELAEAFRGWKQSPALLERAVSREVKNPFTGKPMTISSRVPEGPHAWADADAVADASFRHLPWIDVKGLDPTMLDSLGEVLLDWPAERATGEVSGRELIGPKSAGNVCVFVVPRDLVEAMAELSADRRMDVAKRWAEREQALRPEWAAPRLEALCVFARQAMESGRGVYMWMCP